MLLKSKIREVYLSQKELLKTADTGWERDLLHKINTGTNLVSIITGIRRSGKSTLLKQLIEKKIDSYCFLNFEDPRLSGFELSDFEKLDEIFAEEGENPYLLFDEIQNVPQWEKYIRYKQDNGARILLTGSNASLLSRELGTHLTGRHIDYELFPFSYSEFLRAKQLSPGADSFKDYMDEGGFPEYLKYEDKRILFHLANDIIYRDIAVRYGIRNDNLLKQILVYLVTNSSKLFTYNKLRKLFSLGSSNTIIDYITFFEYSYLLFTVPKFSFSLKKQIFNPKKVYTIDTGLINVMSASFSADLGRLLENAVFLYLRRQYKDIFYFAGDHECDFMVKKDDNTISAIQVSFVLNNDNLDREINGLLEAMDTAGIDGGTVITFDQEDYFEKKNKIITVIPAWKFIS